MSNVILRKPRGLFRWIGLYRLYLEAFPPAERKPFLTIVRMYRRGRTDVWCMERDGRFAGLATTINAPDLVLLDYFAVKRAGRGRGTGTAALAQLQRIYADRGLFVEIESTRGQYSDLPARIRRRRFYQNGGMRALSVRANVFGVEMELLGSRCTLDFEQYQAFYRTHYGRWAADHITPAEP